MPPFELALGERTLQKPPFLVAELPELVVAPDKEGAVVECDDAVTPPAAHVVDPEGLVAVVEVDEARDVLDEGQILDVTHTVDTQLAAQVVAAGIDFLNVVGLGVTAKDQRKFFTTGRI